MMSASSSPQPRQNHSHETPSVILAPIGYHKVEGADEFIRRRAIATTVPADSSPEDNHNHVHDRMKRQVTLQKNGSYAEKNQRMERTDKQLQSLQAFGRQRLQNDLFVPREVTVEPQSLPFTRSNAPLYSTSKTSVRALFPLDADRKPLLSWTDGAAACSSPADLVLHRLVTLCFECHVHSTQLLESVMLDLAQHVTRSSLACGADNEESEAMIYKDMAKSSVTRAVVEVMRTHPQHVSLQMEACRILCYFGKISLAKSPQQCTSSTESVQAVLECLDHHHLNTNLVSLALATLIHMGAHFPYHEALFGQETLEFMVHGILRKHLNCPDVQVEMLFLLGNLSCNLALAQIIVRAGGIPAVVESINVNWQNAKVSEGGALALFKLSKWSHSRKRLIVEHGGYAAVFRAAQAHPEGLVGSAARAALDVLT
jgi:hypothetical protein